MKDFHVIRAEAVKQFRASHVFNNAITWNAWKRAFHAGYDFHESSAPASGVDWEARAKAAEKVIINETNDGYSRTDYETWYDLYKLTLPNEET